MKKQYILILVILFASLLSKAQQPLQTVIIGEAAVLEVTGANGTVQWQESTDSLSWTAITGATTNPYSLTATSSPTGKRFYRAAITNASICQNSVWYSTVIRHRIITTTAELQIGYWFHGGIVFYILADGDIGYVAGETHGLIAAEYDQSEGCQWGCSGSVVPGADSSAIGTGMQNTTDIVAFHDGLSNYYGNPTQCNSANNGTVAAKLCDTLGLNGFTDWYLPSLDELEQLYLQRNIVGGFSSSNFYYWSSTEFNPTYAFTFTFSGGYSTYYLKTNTLSVRSVRAF